MRKAGTHRLHHPDGHRGPRGRLLVPIRIGKRQKNRFEAAFYLFRAEPCQGTDDNSRLSVGGVSCQRGAFRSSTMDEPKCSRWSRPEVK